MFPRQWATDSSNEFGIIAFLFGNANREVSSNAHWARALPLFFVEAESNEARKNSGRIE
jgi:hypothetical protein